MIVIFFNDTATTEIYTLSLHDALPICMHSLVALEDFGVQLGEEFGVQRRSEEHTSELQVTVRNLVCRLLLEKRFVIRHSSILSSHGPRSRFRYPARLL